MAQHVGVRVEFASEMNRLLSMLGLGGHSSGAAPTVTGGGSSFMSGRMSQYADGDAPKRADLFPKSTSGGNPAFDFSGKDTGVGSSGGGMSGFISGAKASDVPLVRAFGVLAEIGQTKVTVGPFETDVKTLVGGLVAGAAAGNSDPAKATSPAGSDTPEAKAQKTSEEQKKAAEDKAKADAAAAAKTKADNEEATRKKEEEKKKSGATGSGTGYVDPDQAQASIVPPTAAQFEAVAKSRGGTVAHPVNPNDDVAPRVDASSPPLQNGPLDPTVAYIDPEGGFGGTQGGFSGTTDAPRTIGALIYPVRDFEPPVCQWPPDQSGGQDSAGHPDWP